MGSERGTEWSVAAADHGAFGDLNHDHGVVISRRPFRFGQPEGVWTEPDDGRHLIMGLREL